MCIPCPCTSVYHVTLDSKPCPYRKLSYKSVKPLYKLKISAFTMVFIILIYLFQKDFRDFLQPPGANVHTVLIFYGSGVHISDYPLVSFSFFNELSIKHLFLL